MNTADTMKPTAETNEAIKAAAQRHLNILSEQVDALQTLIAGGYDAQAADTIADYTSASGYYQGHTDLPGALDAARNEAAEAA